MNFIEFIEFFEKLNEANAGDDIKITQESAEKLFNCITDKEYPEKLRRHIDGQFPEKFKINFLLEATLEFELDKVIKSLLSFIEDCKGESEKDYEDSESRGFFRCKICNNILLCTGSQNVMSTIVSNYDFSFFEYCLNCGRSFEMAFNANFKKVFFPHLLHVNIR